MRDAAPLPDSRATAGATATLPLVSVVLASRNRARYVDQALDSLARQTYTRLEILLVDDGSTDGTSRRLEDFAHARSGTVLLRTEGIGPAAARARAFEIAQGELLGLQDDDDRSHPERIARQVRHLIEHPEIVLLGTAADIIDERGDVVGRYPLRFTSIGIRRQLRRGSPFVHGSVLMRRDAYRRAGGYRAAFTVAEDLDLYLRIASIGELANLHEPLYAWRLHSDNTLARSESAHVFFPAAARAFEHERRRTGGDSEGLLEQLRDPERFLEVYPFAGRVRAYMGEAYARVGMLTEARRELKRALGLEGGRGHALLWSALGVPIALLRRARGIRSTHGLALEKSAR
jgi:glycosyltransferase involved in cell wall biosynthesis